MKRIKRHPIMFFLAEALFITLVVGTLILILGTVRSWESAIRYSNAFFIAGLLIFATGVISRISAGQGLFTLPSITAESYKKMDASERFSFIIKANSPIRLVLLGTFTGAMLILVSLILANAG